MEYLFSNITRVYHKSLAVRFGQAQMISAEYKLENQLLYNYGFILIAKANPIRIYYILDFYPINLNIAKS